MTNIPLDAIRMDGDTQARAETSDEHVADLYEAIVAGAEMPPVILFHDGGPDYWIGDGHHRIAAYKQAKYRQVKAEVRQGGFRDAQLFACGANTEHGLKRTNSDKRDAVATLLFDVQHPCQHGHHVCGDRRPTDQCWSQFSDRDIARRCAVSQPFVSKLRAELVPASVSDNNFKIETVRTVTRGGTTYPMNTANIGGTRKPIPATIAREREERQQRTVDRSVSQEPGDETPTSPLQFRRPLADDLVEESPNHSSAIADTLAMFAEAIAGRLAKSQEARSEWLEYFRPLADEIANLPIGDLAREIDKRLASDGR